MNELHLFAGGGGGILGGMLLGHSCVCAVELDPYCREILLQRQRDGILPRFPVWDDIRTFDGGPWRGRVDIVCGGFPCQDISRAGKGEGIDGARSGMWMEMARIIGEVRPKHVFVENSPMLVSRGLGRVLGDLAKMGYNARWGVLGGSHIKHSPILRERIWILASATSSRRDAGGGNGQNTKREVLESEGLVSYRDGWNGWDSSPKEKARILGMADGVAGELDGIKCCGNGQVPILAALAWEILLKPEKEMSLSVWQ